MMIASSEDVERLVQNRIPEGPALEYKQELNLSGDRNRAELLKDLTGIGNGGGGTIIFGIAEDRDNDGLPSHVQPLSERSFVPVLEDIVRTAIRPSLLMSLTEIDFAGGFVLVVDVRRSTLGPYMVEGYGQRRYFVRQGTRTAPMTEQQVRDHHLLATRGRERRPIVWAEHGFDEPPATEDPWLVVCALPEEPLTDIFDPGSFSLDELNPEPVIETFPVHAELADLRLISSEPQIWAHGVFTDYRYSEDRPPTSMLRLYRNGAVLIAQQFYEVISTWTIARALTATLAYIAHIWQKLELTSTVEVEARLENLAQTRVDEPGPWAGQREPRQPSRGPRATVILRREMIPTELLHVGARNLFARDFADRLNQAFGFRDAPHMFRRGWLFDKDGYAFMSISGAGVWNQDGNQQGFVDELGVIRNSRDDICGYFRDGVIIDEEGLVMAALELAPSPALPADFTPGRRVPDDPRPRVPGGNPGTPTPPRGNVNIPKPVAKWSEKNLNLCLNPLI